MKRFRSGLISLAVLGLLAAYIAFFERGPKEDEKKPLLSFHVDDVEKIEIHNSNSHLELVKQENTWNIVRPQKYTADADAMRALLNNATDLVTEGKLEKPAALSDYALDPAQSVIIFTLKNASPVTIKIGKETIAGGKRYLQREGDPSVYLVTAYRADALRKSLDDLRNKHIFPADMSKTKKIEIFQEGRLKAELEKDEQNKWRLMGAHEAQEDAVRDFLHTLDNLRVTEFVSDTPSNLSRYGLVSPRAAVHLWEGNADKPRKLLIGGKKSDTYSVYVKTEEAPVYLAGEYIVKELQKTPSDFRDKDFLAFDPSKPVSLKVTYRGKSHLYEKKDGVWTAEGRPQAAKEAPELIGQAAALHVEDFAPPQGKDLDTPRGLLEIFLEGGEKRVLRFGKQEENKIWINTKPAGEAYLIPVSLWAQVEAYFSNS